MQYWIWCRGLMPACYFGMCHRSLIYRSWKCALHVCGAFVCLSCAWPTSTSIRACWGCSYIRLCFKYETCLRYCCSVGTVRWNRMKSTAVVAHRHIPSYTRVESQMNVMPFSRWLIQTHTHTKYVQKLDKIWISICRSSGWRQTWFSLACLHFSVTVVGQIIQQEITQWHLGVATTRLDLAISYIKHYKT